MAIRFQNVTFPPLQQVSCAAPDGALIGLVGEHGHGSSDVLHLAAGTAVAVEGEVSAAEPRRLLGPQDRLNFAPVRTLCLDQTLALQDGLVRGRAMAGLERLRQSGTTILLTSHDTALLRPLCDEVWWFQDGRLHAKGDPKEVLDQYERLLSRKLKEWAQALSMPLAPSLRRGDGRAEITSLSTLDRDEQPAAVWQSGQLVHVRVGVIFHAAVADPVVGIMIRTRIGFEVYGTNTELERVNIGAVRAGETVQVLFSFVCHLCPQAYTLTAASHDPDGVWHDWLEDAVAFSVADTRYTAGVANLRASVTVERR